MFLGQKIHSQVIYSWIQSSPSFSWGHIDMGRYNVIDTTYLDITYSMSRRMIANEDSLSGEDLLELQLGRRYNAFFSRPLREVDSINTQDMIKKMYIKPHPEGCMGFELFYDNINATLKVDNRIPFLSRTMEYEEPIPKIEWLYLQNDTLTVMGYLCYGAECGYGGREWKVYYTPDISLPYGPWKLIGAKGLILRAADKDGDYVFEVAGMTQQPKPIIRYEWSRKQTTKDDFMKYERDIHEKAGAYIRNNKIRYMINDNSEKGYHLSTEDWAVYYCPLER